MFCPNCGHENSNENKYCMKCGKDIKKESESFNADTYNKGNNLGGNYSGQNNTIPPYKEKIIAKYDSIYSRGSKIIRLVVGIISIVLSLFSLVLLKWETHFLVQIRTAAFLDLY